MNAVLQDRAPDDTRPVVVMGEDEARFGRISTVQRAWAPVGVRPTVPHQIVRESRSAYTAVAPAHGTMTTLVLPRANTAMMNLFLAQVATDFADSFVVMQVDGAGWHTSADLQVPEHIRLIVQPAYSPQLNPVEHLWDDIRENEFPHVLHESLDAVEHAVSAGLRRLAAVPDTLRSMTFFPHIRDALAHLPETLTCTI
ncbi:MAG: IS630 family transposase [Chloroflexaceae bacterium]